MKWKNGIKIKESKEKEKSMMVNLHQSMERCYIISGYNDRYIGIQPLKAGHDVTKLDLTIPLAH